MPAPSIPQEWYENLAQRVFHWFTRKDVTLWFHGEYLERDRRTEIVLKRLKDAGKLVAVQHGLVEMDETVVHDYPPMPGRTGRERIKPS